MTSNQSSKLLLEFIVSEGMFCFTASNTAQCRARELLAPMECRSEKIEIVRNGEVIDIGAIRTVGTHGSFEAFAGLRMYEVEGRRTYPMVIRSGDFQEGDVIRIFNNPYLPHESGEQFWLLMCPRK